MAYKKLQLFWIYSIAFLFCAGSAFAQNGKIEGNITDSKTGEPIIGANVYIESLNKGASSDQDGQYTIADVPFGNYTLRISYVGYTTKDLPVTVDDATITINTTLVENVSELGETVVTALGIQREARSLGYSVQKVEGEELAQTKEVNFVSSLTSKVAGANISSSNAMGGSSRIILRGAKSVTGDNQPLFVVDGVPLDNSNFTGAIDDDGIYRTTEQGRGSGGYDFGNAASMIDPNNIASVTVLKGASASALYGSRGANGVIEITTKNGSETEGLGLTINSGVTFSQVYGLPDYQNKYGGGSNAPFIEQDGQLFVDYGTDESWGPRLDGRLVRQWYSFDDVNGLNGQATPWVAHPNNVKDFFDTGVSFNNNVSLSKGDKNYSYRLSLTRLDNTDVYPESNLDRKQVGFNGQAHLSNKLSASINSNYIYENATGRPGTGYDNENVFLQFSHFGQRQVQLGPN